MSWTKHAALAAMVLLLLALVPASASGAQQAPLLVGPITFSEKFGVEGDPVDITVSVTNLLPAPQPNVTVYLYNTGGAAFAQEVDMAPGQTLDVTFTWNATRGYHLFTGAATMPDGSLSPPMSVPYLVNSSIEVGDLRFSAATPRDGEKVTISVTIHNTNADPLDDLRVRIMRQKISYSQFGGAAPGFKDIYNESGISLAGNEQRTFEAQWESMYGNQTIGVEVIQETPFGNDTVAANWAWIEVDNAYLSPVIAGMGILVMFLTMLVAITMPCMLNRFKNGK